MAAYVPAVRTGNYVYTSGQLPMVAGVMPATGKVGGAVACAPQLALLGVEQCVHFFDDRPDLQGHSPRQSFGASLAHRLHPAAKAAGFENDDDIGPYLRSLILDHHDTLTTPVR